MQKKEKKRKILSKIKKTLSPSKTFNPTSVEIKHDDTTTHPRVSCFWGILKHRPISYSLLYTDKNLKEETLMSQYRNIAAPLSSLLYLHKPQTKNQKNPLCFTLTSRQQEPERTKQDRMSRDGSGLVQLMWQFVSVRKIIITFSMFECFVAELSSLTGGDSSRFNPQGV